MKNPALMTVICGAVGIAVGALAAEAGSAKKDMPQAPAAATAEHPKSATYRRAPQVRGFIQRRGGYSYASGDTTFTYGDTRSAYGSANSTRGPWFNRQTGSGPFDNGFFFDSGIGPRGGDSPYRN